MPKLTVEFNDGMNELLQELAARDRTTKVDIIRRALALYRYVIEETDKPEKRRLAIAEGDKVVKEIVLH
jgi:predicted transcriptional regulator